MPEATPVPQEAEAVKIAPVSVRKLPHDRLPDATWLLLRDGYRFVSKRCERHASDVFRTRLMFQSVVCMRGEAAARVFYDPGLFERKGAVPTRLKRLLFGEGSLQDLDREEHRARKQMFLSVLSSNRMREMVSLFDRKWGDAVGEWGRPGGVVLFDEAVELLFRSVCEWGGIDYREWEVPERCADLVSVIEGVGSVGPGTVMARRARERLQEWTSRKVEAVRLREPVEPDGDEPALTVFSWHRDADGTLPEKRVVATELLNLLIGTAMVAYYVVFCAHALDAHPQWRRRLQEGDKDEEDRFVEEIRRFYPLFPFVTAVARDGFEWHGYRFKAGQKVLLDLYGTNHHPDSWGAPDKFHPDRFQGREEGAFDLIPQGGGLPEATHRCAGEPLTVELMRVAVRRLTRSMEYEVPRQDLRIDLSCIPTGPRSGFVMENVKSLE